MRIRSIWPAWRWWPGLLLATALLVLAGCKGGAAGTAGSPAGAGASGSAAGSGQTAPAGSGPAGASGSGGASGAAGSPGAAPGTLCASTGVVNRVVIARLFSVDKIPQPVAPALPRSGLITITDPAQARALAVAVCGLPSVPAGIVNCPAQVGAAVELRFSAPGKPVWPVVIRTTGCQTVQGLTPVRTAAQSPAFWALLLRLAGPLGITHTP